MNGDRARNSTVDCSQGDMRFLCGIRAMIRKGECDPALRLATSQQGEISGCSANTIMRVLALVSVVMARASALPVWGSVAAVPASVVTSASASAVLASVLAMVAWSVWASALA